MPSATDAYRLGQRCTFSLNGQLVRSVTLLNVRRTAEAVDVTGFLHNVTSSLVTRRTLELEVELLKPSEAQRFRDAEERGAIVTVQATNGLREFNRDFTVHDSQTDEPLDDAVRARFTLKQWAHPRT
jgi:hypothetical protein